MKTILRKLFGASASGGVMGGLYLLALTGLVLAAPNRAEAAEVTGRYLRLTVTHTQTKSDTCETTHNAGQYGVALAEMRLFHGDEEVKPVAVASNYPDGDGSSTNLAHLTNGTTAGNDKFWVTDSTLSGNLTVTFDLGEGGATLDSYELTLADVRYRHPVAWRMEISDDQVDWMRVDRQDYGRAADVPEAYAVVTRAFQGAMPYPVGRYLRVTFTHTQNRADTINPGGYVNGFGLAIAELEAYSGDTKLTPATVTVPVDGEDTSNKKDKLTDGIVADRAPSYFDLRTAEGSAPKREREWMIDGGPYSRNTVRGEEAFFQFDMHNYSKAISRAVVTGSLVYDDKTARGGYEMTWEASNDGENWVSLAVHKGAGLPGKARSGRVKVNDPVGGNV